jgi:hypothetical protein
MGMRRSGKVLDTLEVGCTLVLYFGYADVASPLWPLQATLVVLLLGS